MIAAFRSVNCYIVKVSFVCLSVASAYCLSVLLMVAFLKDNLVSDLGNPGCLDFYFSWNKNAYLIRTSANVIYYITCTLCKKLYIGETGRRLDDPFREHLRDVEKDDKDASKPVARHFNLPNHSKEHMSICGLSLHQGTTDSRKNLEQKFIFQIGTLNPHGINERFSFN